MLKSELIQLLEKFPDNMEVIVEEHSDYADISPNQISVVKGVRSNCGTWIMRSHSTMSGENKNNEKDYILIAPKLFFRK